MKLGSMLRPCQKQQQCRLRMICGTSGKVIEVSRMIVGGHTMIVRAEAKENRTMKSDAA